MNENDLAQSRKTMSGVRKVAHEACIEPQAVHYPADDHLRPGIRTLNAGHRSLRSCLDRLSWGSDDPGEDSTSVILLRPVDIWDHSTSDFGDRLVLQNAVPPIIPPQPRRPHRATPLDPGHPLVVRQHDPGRQAGRWQPEPALPIITLPWRTLS